MGLKKGTENVSWANENGVIDTPWYDTIDFTKLKTPPHLGKNAKGWRFDFSSYENLHQKAMTIKEALPYYYKNENDVYKDAHYIGMYILERVIVNKDRFREFDEMLAITSNGNRKSLLKIFAREQFLKFYEEYCTGIISEDVLVEIMEKIADTIASEKIKKWFIGDCEAILSSDQARSKISGKLYKRGYRERIAEAKERGISVIEM